MYLYSSAKTNKIRGFMSGIGTVGGGAAIGAVSGGVLGLSFGGVGGLITGVQTGLVVGAKAGSLLKAERGVDAAGRKVEQIITDASAKLGECADKVTQRTVDTAEKNIDVVAGKVGNSIDKIGQSLSKATSHISDKVAESVCKAVDSFVDNWTGIAIASYSFQALFYVAREGAEAYGKYCRNGKDEIRDITCISMAISNLAINLGITAMVYVICNNSIQTIKEKRLKK